MEREEIEQRLTKVNSEIESLIKERNKLEENLLSTADSFEEKFRIWWFSDNKIDNDWLIGRGTKLREWYDKNYDLNRYETYDVCDNLAEDMEFLTNPEEYQSWIEKHPKYAHSEEKKAFLIEVAKDMMEQNIGTFKCDW